MSSGLATFFKILGTAIIIAAIVLAVLGILDDVIKGTFDWFKAKIGMTMIIPLVKNPKEAVMMLWV